MRGVYIYPVRASHFWKYFTPGTNGCQPAVMLQLTPCQGKGIRDTKLNFRSNELRRRRKARN